MSARRLLAMAYKEALQIWRDPRSLAIALLLPLMQMVLLGYGVSLDIRRVPLCIQDQERSQLSRALVERFVASGWFKVVRYLDSDYAIRAALDRNVCIGAVTIPVDFSRRYMQTGNAAVQAVFDATDVNTTNIAIGYAQGVIAATTTDFEARWAAAHASGGHGPVPRVLDYEPRVWFNEGLDSRNFIIPAVVAVIVALIGAQLTSLTIARERERGTMERLISTPVTALEVMIGKLIPYFGIGLFDAAFCLAMTVFWFDVPFRGAIAPLLAATMLFTLVVLGIGYLISVWIDSQLGASQVALLLTMTPVSMLSGYTFPIDQMPVPIQGVTLLVHARYYVSILRSVFLKGSGFADLLLPMGALALYAIVIVAAAARALHKRLD